MINFISLLVLVVAGTNIAMAIECNFKYEVDNNQRPSTISNSLGSSSKFKPRHRATRSSEEVFECEDSFDDFKEITNINVTSRVKPVGVDMRFGPSDDDDYESTGADCVSNKKTIKPSKLNNVFNKAFNVVNHATFVQTIEIDECRTRNEPCNNGGSEPAGKKLLCRQKYVKITLKAFKDDGNEIIDELFYYPSNCICELVQRKKS